ncbi:glycosyl transferase family 28 [Palleronia aestuarii]|uniref:Glycosyl transferase family 28 n=1 Tax=Palleronia aestuarii TaxID=568105 RepID=A0A2W7NHT8_9RHOB|nr:glycosyltransferase [Palleronia aestuarii]PZX16224.1 glycosyl transferase family 28 [Palleronia aestuarii]
MRDFVGGGTARPFGYFVHHQGRGHAERCRAIAQALPPERPIRIFCARPDLLGTLPDNARITEIPSLFEPRGDEPPAMDQVGTPDTLHCAPLGWSGIREAMGTMTTWFATADPALMICDVSAELAQLCRICSVPHVKVLQHGERGDPGHRAAYDGAAGLLAPFHAALAQPDWSEEMLAKTCFAGGLGVEIALPDRPAARARLGIDPGRRVIVVMSGGGGSGFTRAPLGIGARTWPDTLWLSVGQVEADWHATEPGNLDHRGWVDNPGDYIAAADVIVASSGNTTCQRILASGTPWIVIPEWRYFDEQVEKARALARAGAAHHLPHLPSSAQAWRQAIADVEASHVPERQRALVDAAAGTKASAWLEALAARLWSRGRTDQTEIVEETR